VDPHVSGRKAEHQGDAAAIGGERGLFVRFGGGIVDVHRVARADNRERLAEGLHAGMERQSSVGGERELANRAWPTQAHALDEGERVPRGAQRGRVEGLSLERSVDARDNDVAGRVLGRI
jgi:hypothetical protein